jgi:hypothetical protein
MENNSIVGLIPWPVAAAAAIWFGVMAYKASKNCALWAIGGGLLGLVVTTIVMGLAQATFTPYSTEEIAPLRFKVALLAILLVLCIGWLFTGALHRHLLAALKRTQAPPPTEAPTKPPAPGLKQSPGQTAGGAAS